MTILEKIGAKLARHLSASREDSKQIATNTPDKLSGSLHPGDVLLVEGNSGFSVAIKYLTQSSWSHAALYVGDALPTVAEGKEQAVLVEADINDGVRSVGLSMYTHFHTRICRPVGLDRPEIFRLSNRLSNMVLITIRFHGVKMYSKYLVGVCPETPNF